MAKLTLRHMPTVADAAKPCLDIAAICWAETHQGTAAWLQAILTPVSVLLALLAILAPSWIRKQDREEERKELLRQAATVAAAAAGTVRLVHNAAQFAQSAPSTHFAIPRALLENGIRPVREFPMHKLADSAAAEAIHTVRLFAESAMEDADHLELFAREGSVPQPFVSMLRDREEQAEKAWRKLALLAGAKDEETH